MMTTSSTISSQPTATTPIILSPPNTSNIINPTLINTQINSNNYQNKFIQFPSIQTIQSIPNNNINTTTPITSIPTIPSISTIPPLQPIQNIQNIQQLQQIQRLQQTQLQPRPYMLPVIMPSNNTNGTTKPIMIMFPSVNLIKNVPLNINNNNIKKTDSSSSDVTPPPPTKSQINANINGNNSKLTIKSILQKLNAKQPLDIKETIFLQTMKQAQLNYYQRIAALNAAALNIANINAIKRTQQLNALKQTQQLRTQQQLQIHQLQLLQHRQQLINAQQQQQRIKKQQQQQQQRLQLNNNSNIQQNNKQTKQPYNKYYAYNNNNNNNNPPPHNYNLNINNYSPQNIQNMQNNNNYLNVQNNIYQNNSVTSYFKLPEPDEFDKLFCIDDSNKEKDNDGFISLFAKDIDDIYDDNYNDNNLNFNIKLDGFGICKYGKQVYVDYNKYNKTLRTSSINLKMYKTYGVRDITSECCEWLIKDLMQHQSKSISLSKIKKEQKCNVFMRISSDYDPDINILHKDKDISTKIVNTIKSNPIIPQIFFDSNIYPMYHNKNQLVEISHICLSESDIELVNETSQKEISFTDILNVSRNCKGNTLEFINFCKDSLAMIKQEKIEIKIITHNDNRTDKLLYETAEKLRQNPNYFNIPNLLPNTLNTFGTNKPIDRQLFGTKISINNNINNINNTTFTNTNIFHPNTNIIQYNTNHNTINTVNTLNALNKLNKLNPINTVNAVNAVNAVPIRFVYPINNNNNKPQFGYHLPNGYMVQQSNMPTQRLVTVPLNLQNQIQIQQRQKKIPNATSWNVGSL